MKIWDTHQSPTWINSVYKILKNMYFHNIEYDKKQITEKYGAKCDPLLGHTDFNYIKKWTDIFQNFLTFLLVRYF